MHLLCILRENSHELIVNLKLEIQNCYTVMYWLSIINPENMKIFVWLLMHVIRLFISILTDFVTSHKIAFYSKLYDIDFLENCTHDRTYITLYVHERLHQHRFLDKKAPRTTLISPSGMAAKSRRRLSGPKPTLWPAVNQPINRVGCAVSRRRLPQAHLTGPRT